jgi:tetratricopeptide (TPR) repeat protein
LGQTVTVVVQDTIQTFTETLPLVDTSPETSETTRTAESAAEATALPALGKGDPGTTEAKGEAGDSIAIVEAAEAAEARPSEASDIEAGITKPVAAVGPAPEAEVAEAVAGADSQEPAETADSPTAAAAQDPSLLDLPEHIAYEEFLKDTHEPVDLFDAPVDEEPEAAGTQEPVAKIDPSGELQIEMDTKNAHVWNELGNVYYNTTAYDDAIVAYSKAIELDRWFAWPYSNLALAYVQKRRFVEAILLYQRSIELFSSDKDKAVSWNRLGNVYRRLNDYENAIAAYQRADALDPDNATLSLQSRFSLLGNYAMDQKPTYVS